MKDNNKENKYSKNLSSKLFIQLKLSNIYPENNKLSLINNISDINQILKEDYSDKMKLFYYNRENIHNILYNDEEIITIDNTIIQKTFSNYYYLASLIICNKDILNYNYNKDFIKDLDDLKQTTINKLSKILFSKIINELIDNYKNSDSYDEENDKDIKKLIEENNSDIINESTNLQDFGIDLSKINFQKKSHEEIYSEIILKILEKLFEIDTSEKFDHICDFAKIIQLEDIDITEKTFQKINILLMSHHEKEIRNLGDIYKKDKINFYYFLFEYILKYSYYLYSCPFLLKTRKNVLSIIKSNKLSGCSEKNDLDHISKDRLIFCLKKIFDSEYYFNKFEILANNSHESNYIDNKEDKTNNNDSTKPKTKNGKTNNLKDKNYKNIKDEKYIDIKNDNNNLQKDNSNERGIKIFKTKTNNLNFNKFEEIINNYCSNNYNKITYILNTLLNIKNNIDNSNRNLYINIIKLINSLEFIKESIFIEAGENKYNQILIKLENNKNFKNQNGISNINCEYEYDKSHYKDWNILVNGCNEGIEALLCDIIYPP